MIMECKDCKYLHDRFKCEHRYREEFGHHCGSSTSIVVLLRGKGKRQTNNNN
jgi:hypothetical protein